MPLKRLAVHAVTVIMLHNVNSIDEVEQVFIEAKTNLYGSSTDQQRHFLFCRQAYAGESLCTHEPGHPVEKPLPQCLREAFVITIISRQPFIIQCKMRLRCFVSLFL